MGVLFRIMSVRNYLYRDKDDINFSYYALMSIYFRTGQLYKKDEI